MKKATTSVVENNYLSYIRHINYYPLLDFKEEQKLAKMSKKGDKKARQKLIQSNLKLVIKVAMQYYKAKYDLMDLIQEGNIGLITAVDKFDHKKKLRFSTYSVWWIKHYIARCILREKFRIKLPLRKMELLFKIEKTIYNLYQKFHRLPNVNELGLELHIKEKKIKDMLEFIFPVLSLDSPIASNNDLSLKDVISSREFQPEEIVFNHQLIEYELKILGSLVKREAEVLKYRYGFYDGKNFTLKAVAKIFDISQEAIRQIELRAIARIRLNYQDLKDYLVN